MADDFTTAPVRPYPGCGCCPDLSSCVDLVGVICITLTSGCTNFNGLAMTATEASGLICRHWQATGPETTVGGCVYSVIADFYCGCVNNADPCPPSSGRPNCAVMRIGGPTNCGGNWFLVTEPGGSDRNLPIAVAGGSGTGLGYVAYDEGLEGCTCPCPVDTSVTISITNSGCEGDTIELPCCIGVDFPEIIYLDTTGGPTYPGLGYEDIPPLTNIPFVLTYRGTDTVRYDQYDASTPSHPAFFATGAHNPAFEEMFFGNGYIYLCDLTARIVSLVLRLYTGGPNFTYAIAAQSGASVEFSGALSCTTPFWSGSTTDTGWANDAKPNPATWTLHD